MPGESVGKWKEREAACFQAGIYIRLSREDGNGGESESIAGQRALLREFAAERPEIEIREEYADDGYSGVSFDRPAFRRMMKDVDEGRINCILVKDLSRLGRDYIETGYYLERVFPLKRLRFIAVSDQIDTWHSPGSGSDLLASFRNIINDSYARDISVKVRGALRTKQRQGRFIGAFAPYGYRKDPQDKNRLLIDGEAARVVELIFRWRLEGKTAGEIARRLTELKIPSPSCYKKQEGFAYGNPNAGEAGWSACTVGRMLRSRVYAGDMVQHRSTVLSYKLKKAVPVEEREWVTAEGTHAPIVSREDFNRVQRLLGRPVKRGDGGPGLFSGLLVCADCGRGMHRMKSGKYAYYVCGGYKSGESTCTRHSLREDRLEETAALLLERCKKTAENRLKNEEKHPIFDKNRGENEEKHPQNEPQNGAGAFSGELLRIRRVQLSLYEDRAAGRLPESSFRSLLEEAQARENRLAALQRETELHPSDDPAKGVSLPEKLDRRLLCSLIEEIRVWEGGRMEIHWRFEGESVHSEHPGGGMKTHSSS